MCYNLTEWDAIISVILIRLKGGRKEGWKVGRLEGWKIEGWKMEEWKGGRWKSGRVEGWKSERKGLAQLVTYRSRRREDAQ